MKELNWQKAQKWMPFWELEELLFWIQPKAIAAGAVYDGDVWDYFTKDVSNPGIKNILGYDIGRFR